MLRLLTSLICWTAILNGIKEKDLFSKKNSGLSYRQMGFWFSMKHFWLFVHLTDWQRLFSHRSPVKPSKQLTNICRCLIFLFFFLLAKEILVINQTSSIILTIIHTSIQFTTISIVRKWTSIKTQQFFSRKNTNFKFLQTRCGISMIINYHHSIIETMRFSINCISTNTSLRLSMIDQRRTLLITVRFSKYSSLTSIFFNRWYISITRNFYIQKKRKSHFSNFQLSSYRFLHVHFSMLYISTAFVLSAISSCNTCKAYMDHFEDENNRYWYCHSNDILHNHCLYTFDSNKYNYHSNKCLDLNTMNHIDWYLNRKYSIVKRIYSNWTYDQVEYKVAESLAWKYRFDH